VTILVTVYFMIGYYYFKDYKCTHLQIKLH